MNYESAGAAFAVTLVVMSAVPAFGAEGCSSDTFVVRETPVTVGLCMAPASARTPGKTSATVVETLSVKGQTPLVRRVTIDAALAGDTVRTIDDAPLAALGIAGTLHVTIAYRSGEARLEHALLVPGAIVLK